MWSTRESAVELSVSFAPSDRAWTWRTNPLLRQTARSGRSQFSVPTFLSLGRLDRAPGRTWFDPEGAPRRGSCHRRGWYVRHGRGVRTHETRPAARRVRGFSHGWPVAFTAIRGCADRRDRRAGRNAFPVSSTAFYHYVDLLGLETAPFPNPLTPASNSTVIHIEGTTHYAEQVDTLPALFQEVSQAWADALEGVAFTRIQDAIRARDVASLKALWNKLVPIWDDRTFYDFVASSEAFSKLSFHHREVFGQVGFGTGAGTPISRTRCWRSSVS